MEVFPTSEAWFMPEGLFDHCPFLVRVHKWIERGNCPFKYYNMWSKAPDFQRMVREAWSIRVSGTTMFCMVQKLKSVKKEMKMLNKEGFHNIQTADAQAYEYLLECQRKLQGENGMNNKDKEVRVAADYRKIHENFSYLKQKDKLEWLVN